MTITSYKNRKAGSQRDYWKFEFSFGYTYGSTYSAVLSLSTPEVTNKDIKDARECAFPNDRWIPLIGFKLLAPGDF